jgi:hypothetical protein
LHESVSVLRYTYTASLVPLNLDRHSQAKTDFVSPTHIKDFLDYSVEMFALHTCYVLSRMSE